MTLSKTTGVMALATAILVTATGGITLAATSHHGGYVACASKSGTLALRSHGRCPKADSKVSVGAAGPRGKPGAAAVPRMYEGYGNGGTLSQSSAAPTTVASTPTLHAGEYDVTYTVDVVNSGDAPGIVDCNGVASIGLVMPDNFVENPEEGSAAITDTNAVELTKSSAISIACTEDTTIDLGPGGSDEPSDAFAHVIAVPVSGLNEAK